MIELDFNLVGQSGPRAADTLRRLLVPRILERLPQAELVILYGSAARGELTADSDIDVMVFLPKKQLQQIGADFGQLADEVWGRTPVDLGVPFPLELLFADEAWNNDFLLYALHEALPLHDPRGLLAGRQRVLAKWPPEVRRQKTVFVGRKIIDWLARLEQRVRKRDQLGAAAIRAKIIKYNLILLHLRQNQFWVASNLYYSAKRLPGSERFLASADRCVANLLSDRADDYLGQLTKQIQEEIIQAGLLPQNFFANYRPWRQPLRYRISENLL
ncbi:MAG: nucleotidyltransferase domain-containing protein [Patescibacteria group bacterium]|nr:nucleotidyltransferase domain-containing protein [Patescibacteria group bacterium]